jgi:hypothetical protein
VPELPADVMRCEGQRELSGTKCPHRLECARYVHRTDDGVYWTAEWFCLGDDYDRRIPITDA